MKTQGLITGRFQPPTIMHEQLIRSALKYSNIQYVQIIESKSNTGSQSNPFTSEFRQKMIKQIFPEDNVRIFVYPTGSLDDIIHTIERENPDIEINQVFCGTDRLAGYKRQLDKYFQDHQEIQLIEIDRDISQINNVSQTKLREQIINNNIEQFKILQPNQIHQFYDIIRDTIVKQNSQIKEQKLGGESRMIDGKRVVKIIIDELKNFYSNDEYEIYAGIRNGTMGYLILRGSNKDTNLQDTVIIDKLKSKLSEIDVSSILTYQPELQNNRVFQSQDRPHLKINTSNFDNNFVSDKGVDDLFSQSSVSKYTQELLIDTPDDLPNLLYVPNDHFWIFTKPSKGQSSSQSTTTQYQEIGWCLQYITQIKNNNRVDEQTYKNLLERIINSTRSEDVIRILDNKMIFTTQEDTTQSVKQIIESQKFMLQTYNNSNSWFKNNIESANNQISQLESGLETGGKSLRYIPQELFVISYSGVSQIKLQFKKIYNEILSNPSIIQNDDKIIKNITEIIDKWAKITNYDTPSEFFQTIAKSQLDNFTTQDVFLITKEAKNILGDIIDIKEIQNPNVISKFGGIDNLLTSFIFTSLKKGASDSPSKSSIKQRLGKTPKPLYKNSIKMQFNSGNELNQYNTIEQNIQNLIRNKDEDFTIFNRDFYSIFNNEVAGGIENLITTFNDRQKSQQVTVISSAPDILQELKLSISEYQKKQFDLDNIENNSNSEIITKIEETHSQNFIQKFVTIIQSIQIYNKLLELEKKQRSELFDLFVKQSQIGISLITTLVQSGGGSFWKNPISDINKKLISVDQIKIDANLKTSNSILMISDTETVYIYNIRNFQGNKPSVSIELQKLYKLDEIENKKPDSLLSRVYLKEQKTKNITEGITHIEETDQKEFIEWIRQIIYKNEPIIQSIKYDGIQNISFTFKDGNVYQQRISKGQTELIQTPKQWPSNPIYNGLRSQHQFMVQFYNQNKQIFFRHIDPNQEYSIDCEIIPPIYGNILKYNRPYGTLVLLRPLSGFTDKQFKEFQTELQEIDPLNLKVTQYRIEEESLNIVTYESIEQWKIDAVKEIDIAEYQSQQKEIIEQFLISMEEYMNSKPYYELDLTQYELLTQNLSKFQKPLRSKIKQYKQEIQENLSSRMIDIKSLLIRFINEQIEDETGEPVEGIVLRRGKNQTKIVDKEYFTKLNKFYWQYIQLLNRGSIDPYTNNWIEGYTTQFKKQLSELVDENFRSPLFKKEIKQTEGDSLQSKIINYINTNKKQLMPNQEEIRENQIKIQYEYYKKIEQLLQQLIDNYKGKNLKIKITRKSGKEEIKEFDKYMFERSYEQFLLSKKDMIEFINSLKEQNGMMQVQVIYFKLVGIHNDVNDESNDQIEESTIITEGGKQFKIADRIDYNHIPSTLERFKTDIISKIKQIKKFASVGSVLKKSDSGDLDIQLDVAFPPNMKDSKDQQNFLKDLLIPLMKRNRKQYGLTEMEPDQVVKQFPVSNLVSILFPQIDNNNNIIPEKYVQIDLFFGNFDWIVNYNYSPFLDKDIFDQLENKEGEIYSKYKQIYPQLLLSSTLTQFQKEQTDGSVIKYTISQHGINKIRIRKIQTKRGKEKIVREKIATTNDYIKFFRYFFNDKDLKFVDINSLENLLEYLKTNEKTKHKFNDIIELFVVQCNNNKLEIPEEVKGVDKQKDIFNT